MIAQQGIITFVSVAYTIERTTPNIEPKKQQTVQPTD